jgi:RNA polymerase-associated protein CTR9
MLSLGNYYFSIASGKADHNQMKESYKFFFHVLNEDQTNIYAANGLGMVCAERGEVDAAREIFSKAREAGKAMSEDISTNLAHVYITQKRTVDAERLYQATYRSISSTSGEAVAGRSAYLSECVAFSQLQHGRHEDALRSVQRATHMNPSDIKIWFNMAVVAESAAKIMVTKRTQKSVVEILEAVQDINLAIKIFSFVKLNHHLVKQGTGVRVSSAEKHLGSCEVEFPCC